MQLKLAVALIIVVVAGAAPQHERKKRSMYGMSSYYDFDHSSMSPYDSAMHDPYHYSSMVDNHQMDTAENQGNEIVERVKELWDGLQGPLGKTIKYIFDSHGGGGMNNGCGVGCEVCDPYSSSCSVCKQGYGNTWTGPYMTQMECIACAPNCFHCDDHMCHMCVDGYYRGSDGSCYQNSSGGGMNNGCSEGCGDCDKMGHYCHWCVEGYSSVYGECIKCSVGCGECDPDTFSCMWCIEGYTENWIGTSMDVMECVVNDGMTGSIAAPMSACGYEPGCEQCVYMDGMMMMMPTCGSCAPGFIMSWYNNMCLECEYGCSECRPDASGMMAECVDPPKRTDCRANCLKCEEEYNQCVNCTRGYGLMAGACLECPTYCVNCTDDYMGRMVCNRCEVGFSLGSDNQCYIMGDQSMGGDMYNGCGPGCMDCYDDMVAPPYCMSCDTAMGFQHNPSTGLCEPSQPMGGEMYNGCGSGCMDCYDDMVAPPYCMACDTAMDFQHNPSTGLCEPFQSMGGDMYNGCGPGCMECDEPTAYCMMCDVGYQPDPATGGSGCIYSSGEEGCGPGCMECDVPTAYCMMCDVGYQPDPATGGSRCISQGGDMYNECEPGCTDCYTDMTDMTTCMTCNDVGYFMHPMTGMCTPCEPGCMTCVFDPTMPMGMSMCTMYYR